MADNDNFDTLESAGTLSGTEILPLKKRFRSVRSTVDAIATYVAGAGKALTGTFAGNITALGYSVSTPSVMTETGTAPASSFIQLNSTTPLIAAAITPTVGLYLIVTQLDAGTAGHTLTTAGTFDGTNNTATFNAANETLVLFGLTSTRWAIVSNIGSVALSAV